MEIRNDNEGNGGSRRIDITKSNRDSIREHIPAPARPEKVSHEDVKRAAQDQLTISSRRSESTDSEGQRAQRVRELKAQFESGKLDVDGMVGETARRMLGGV